MDRSLSIILPVKNAAGTLQTELTQLIEAAPDLAPSFEILMIDWGSTDDSEEIAMESIRQYPQLHWMRMTRANSAAAVIEAGRQRATCDVIIARQQMPLTPGALRTLWNMQTAEAGKTVTTPQGYMLMPRGAAPATATMQQQSYRLDSSRDVSGRRPPMFISQMANMGR